MPVRISVPESSRNQCSQTNRADKAYDTNAILHNAAVSGINPVIPGKRNRITQRKLRHSIKNTSQNFKEWRQKHTMIFFPAYA